VKALLSFAPLLGQHKAGVFRALALSLLTLLAGIALLGVSGWFLTAAAITTLGVAFDLFAPSAGVRGLAFVRILSRYGEKLAGHDVMLRLLSDIRQWTFARLFAATPLPGIGLGRADLVNRLVADVDALDNAVLTALGPICSAIAVGVAMTIGLAAVLPAATLAYAFCFAIAVIGLPATLIALTRRPGAEVVGRTAELRRAVLDGLDGHRDLVAFGAVERAGTTADDAARRLAAARRRLGVLGGLAGGGTQLLAGLATVLVLAAGLAALREGHFDGPVLAALVLAVAASFEAVGPLVRSATRLGHAAAAAERLAALRDPALGPVEPATAIMPPPGGALELRAVCFGHNPTRPVLEQLSLQIEGGARIAIVGASGTGKSTVASLLVRLADPDAGCIRLEGVDLRDISLDLLRRRIALMTQDAPVFNDTVRNNLRIGRSDADDAALWSALDAAELGGIVRRLPRGLDTFVGEAGATLSSGQARRLTLARTLLARADVLVLDEPTSGLDRETEEAFFGNLGRVRDGRTVILITHAALPPGVVDHVYRLVAGRLEAGSPAIHAFRRTPRLEPAA
jgi:ATP-binding cassette, subfamily C, bacterial CydC